MAYTPINAPASALPGKQYGVDDKTGVLMITNPTPLDIFACDGVMVYYKLGTYSQQLMLIGKAFHAWLTFQRYAGGAALTLNSSLGDIAALILRKRVGMYHYIGMLKGDNDSKAFSGVPHVIAMDWSPAPTEVTLCAIPHRLVAGFYSDMGHYPYYQLPVRSPSTGKRHPQSQGNWAPRPGLYITAQPAGASTSATVPSASYGNPEGWVMARDPNANIPLYVGRMRTGKSYEQVLNLVVDGLDYGDSGNKAKSALKAAITAKLVSVRGVNMAADCPVPFLLGGLHGSVRILGDAMGSAFADVINPYDDPRVGVESVAVLNHCGNPVAGTLAFPSEQSGITMPIPLIGDLVADTYTLLPYWRADSRDARATWSEVSFPLADTVDGLKVSDIVGWQPYLSFVGLNGVKKVNGADRSLAAMYKGLLQTNMHDDTPAPVFTNVLTMTQDKADFAQAGSRAPTLANDPPTIGETWMVTARTLVKLAVDGVKATSTDVEVDEDAIDKIVRLYPLTKMCA